MKGSISVVISLLASTAVARPRATAEGDPLPESSRVTAFVISSDGEPSVECWEITNMINDQQVQQFDGSKGTARMTSLASGRELDGVDILTWPSYSSIWPPPGNSDVEAEGFDLASQFSLFTLQGGLIGFNVNFRISSETTDDQDELHIFSLENGDDWFYFEDEYTGTTLANSVDAPPYPFHITTISSTETEALRLRFNDQPKHTVLHKGACSFTGISVPPPSSSGRTSRVHNPLVQQYRHYAQ